MRERSSISFLSANIYSPGWLSTEEKVSQARLLEMLSHSQLILLYLSGGHFEPMLSCAQRNAAVRPPISILKGRMMSYRS